MPPGQRLLPRGAPEQPFQPPLPTGQSVHVHVPSSAPLTRCAGVSAGRDFGHSRFFGGSLALAADMERMFAVVQVAGHQYKVTTNDVIATNTLHVPAGETIDLKKVWLWLSNLVARLPD
jgi:hypothetical protein